MKNLMNTSRELNVDELFKVNGGYDSLCAPAVEVEDDENTGASWSKYPAGYFNSYFTIDSYGRKCASSMPVKSNWGPVQGFVNF